jgi:hypothetical protein
MINEITLCQGKRQQKLIMINENVSVADIKAAKKSTEVKIMDALLELSRLSGVPLEEMDFTRSHKETKQGVKFDFKITLSVII